MSSEPARCSMCSIRDKSVCGALDASEIKALNQIARWRTYKAGDIILVDGAKSDMLANVVRGVVKLTKSLDDGRQQIVGLIFPPDFLGRAYRPEATYFAEAATDVELCTFPKVGFEKFLHEHPNLEHRLLEHTLSELDACREWALLLGRKSAEEKVASFLLMIAKRAPRIGCSHSDNMEGTKFELPLSRADIADFLGLTIETVSRQITKLKSRGVIELASTRDLSVPNLAKLKNVAHQEAA
ncbi:MAG: Crp/Fnr family transcriptional regulator [Hyphomicrobiaceae bacterium]